MSKETRGRLLNIVKIVVSLGVLVVLVSQVDVQDTVQHLAHMNWPLFLAAMALYLAGVLVRAYRWGVLVWSLGVRVSWWRLVALYFVGAFFSQVLPTGVGGDAVRMYELARDDTRPLGVPEKAVPREQHTAAAISSVLLDRFLGLFFLFAMALVALIGDYRLVSPPVRIGIVVVCAVSMLGIGLLLQRTWIERWGHRLRLDRLLGRVKVLGELYHSLHLYSPAALLKASAASVLFNVMLILAYYLLGLAVGIHLSVWIYFLLIPIISALLLIPSVGGLGVREGGTVGLFAQVGVDQSHALALAVVYDVGVFLTALIGAILYLVQLVREARK